MSAMKVVVGMDIGQGTKLFVGNGRILVEQMINLNEISLACQNYNNIRKHCQK